MDFGEYVVIGEDHFVESGVMLGRLPDREIEITPLVIDDNAFIRSGTVIYACSKIGNGLETGHGVVIREENQIGDNFFIWSNSIVDYGCRIGSNVKVHSLCYIAQFTDIGDDVFIGPGSVFTNDPHPGCPASRECMRGPTIGSGAIIGGNVTILPFVQIGSKALIGAGSVVTKDVPAECVVSGNPAKVVCSIYDLTCRTGLVAKPYER